MPPNQITETFPPADHNLEAVLSAQLDFVLAAADDLGLLPLDPAEAEQAAEWRIDVVEALDRAGLYSDAAQFRDCGKFFGNFNVAVCDDDATHEARAIPYTCHKRYCPDCERRAQAKQVRRLTKIIKRAVERNTNPTFTLKKIELTTDFRLGEDDAPALLAQAFIYVSRWIELACAHWFPEGMTPAERKHGRFDLKARGIGIVGQVEYGEHGRKLHFHLLILCPYIEKQTVTNLWLEATDGLFQVNWIRKIESEEIEDAVREQVKYVTKFTTLPPRLVPALALVLEGQRRMRSFGLFRTDKNDPVEADEPHTCKECHSEIEIVTVRDYFERVIARNAEPSAVILALARPIFLDLKLGNNSGEPTSQHLARSDPDPASNANLPGFNAVFNPGKWS